MTFLLKTIDKIVTIPLTILMGSYNSECLSHNSAVILQFGVFVLNILSSLNLKIHCLFFVSTTE